VYLRQILLPKAAIFTSYLPVGEGANIDQRSPALKAKLDITVYFREVELQFISFPGCAEIGMTVVT